jgi:hypothetical protein
VRRAAGPPTSIGYLLSPTVRVFDFRDAAVSRSVAQSIAARRHEVDPADPRASIRRLESQVAAFQLSASPARARGN